MRSWNGSLRFGVAGIALLCGLVSITWLASQTDIEHKPYAYPPSPRGDHIDDYHGTKVADPYRWLEDPNSEQTREWIQAQNELTFGYLESIPERPRIRTRLTKLWDYERYGVPERAAGLYFFKKNDGLQNQSVLYSAPSLEAKPRVLLDPNKLSDDGTVSLDDTEFSDDGKYLAYSIARAGSDWREWKVREIATGKDLEDHIKWAKFADASWTPDGKGFFYGRYKEPESSGVMTDTNYNALLYYHRLGTPQTEDVLVYRRPDQKEWGFNPKVTEDGDYLTIHVWQGTDERNRFFYKDLRKEDTEVVELLTEFDAAYDFIANDGPVFWFKTNLDAPRYRVIAIDTRNPQREGWKTIIPESEDTLRDVSFVNNMFVGVYMKDAHSEVRVHAKDGKFLRNVDLPGLGRAGGFKGKSTDKETFYYYTSFTTPTTVYRYDMVNGKSEVYRKPKVDFNPQDYETRQVFYRSKDGTRVPMFITFRKGLQLDGRNPTYLYGYGGFNIPMLPAFSVANLVWMEMGGVYAMANLRGGGEYGEEWHKAGSGKNKQNVFDDFIAAAEYLIENKYTSSSHLAIGGGSNGGLLVGAVLNQRPDLFGAALPAVGVMDMLRFHKFTIGWAWVSDYLSSDDPDGFEVLHAYSPLHNITEGTRYPATLVTTADHDDRVVPAHSFKYAAALQAAQAGPAPTLIRIETRAGHGGGTPTSKRIELATDRWSFLVKELGMGAPERLSAD